MSGEEPARHIEEQYTDAISNAHGEEAVADDDLFSLAAELLLVDKVVSLPLEEGMPKLDKDPFVALYELQTGHAAPPRQLWDTPENNELASAEGYHPMACWLMGSEVPSDPELAKLYDEWMNDITGFGDESHE